MHLCISCTTWEGYQIAVQEVRQLLEGIYQEYRQFCRENNRPVPNLHVGMVENHLNYSTGASTTGKKSGGGGKARG